VATERPVGTSLQSIEQRFDWTVRSAALMELACSSRPGSPPPEGVGSPGSVRSRSLGLPRSLHDLFLSPGWPSRSFAPALPDSDREIIRPGPLQLSSPSELSLRAGCSPPLLGFVHFRLSVDAHLGCPLPGARRLPSVEQCHLPDRVPPSRFLTALTASSTRVSRACCIPLPTMRFAAFPSLAASTTRRWPCACSRLPRDALTPFEEFPSPAAAPRHRGRCPLAVSTRSARRFALARASALSPLSWGLCASLPGRTRLGVPHAPPKRLARWSSPSPPKRLGLGPAFHPSLPEQVVARATPLPLRTEARSGSGCRPPDRARRLEIALAAGIVRRVHPSRETWASWSAHAQLLARRSELTGWRLHTVSRRRRQRGACSPCLGPR